MKIKSFVLILGIVLLIGLVSAEVSTLGTFKQNECVQLKQTCADCTYVNIVSVTYPNSSQKLGLTPMVQDGVFFTYDYCDTDLIGQYIVDGEGDVGGTSTVFSYDFEVTYDGNILNTQRAILYIGLIVILVFLFLLLMFNIGKLPSGEVVTDEGLLVDINNLKYLRPIFWALGWGLLLGIVFITSNISIAYLPTAMFGDFFFMLYRVMFLATLPMAIIWFIFLFARMFKDKEIKRMIDRGVDIRGTS